MKKIDIIVGVRPDFIRAAALDFALQDFQDQLNIRYIHTGQHYDPELSEVFFEQLNLQSVKTFLAVDRIEGIGKLASIMMAYENHVLIDPPEFVVVMGNSDSALGCAMVASRNGIKIAHIEAGNRSHDNSIIEEQNDLLIDKLSTVLYTSNEEAVINLIREGFDNNQMMEVGSLHADAVFQNLGHAEDSTVLSRFGLDEQSYIILTLHHEHMLKNKEYLIGLFMMLEEISESLRICVLLHPKTVETFENTPEIISDSTDNLQFISSQNYHDTLKLLKNAALVLTDSQGIQEETSVLGVQCLTLGHITNRPITLAKGTNTLMGYDIPALKEKILSIIEGDRLDGFPIPGWEGKSGQRIAKMLSELL